MGGRGVISMVWEGRNLICAVSPWLLYNHHETTRNEINAAENQLQAPKKHHGLRTPTHRCPVTFFAFFKEKKKNVRRLAFASGPRGKSFAAKPRQNPGPNEYTGKATAVKLF